MPSRFGAIFFWLVILGAISLRAELSPVVLLRPPAQAQLSVRTPDFDWSDSPQAAAYDWQLCQDETFAVVLAENSCDASAWLQTNPLRIGTYFWRVRARSAFDSSVWRQTSFTILFSAPQLLYPFQNSELTDRQPRFDWSDAAGATAYQFMLSTSESFGGPLRDETVAASSWQMDTELPLGLFYWRVRAISTLDSSSWSPARPFEIVSPAPTLFMPANYSETSDRTPVFDWSEPPWASVFDLEIDTVSTFTQPALKETVNSSTFTPAFELPAGTWFWRVRTFSAADTCRWSAVWRVTLIAPPLVLWLRINQGDSLTSAGIVKLNNAACNKPAYYQASERADFAGAFWLPYAEAPEFVLSPSLGAKTIFFKTKNGAGESPVVSDLIARVAVSTVKTNIPLPAPAGFSLLPNYPNPFNATTMIDFELADAQPATVRIVDERGRQVRIWHYSGSARRHRLTWDGRDQKGFTLPSGWFMIQLVVPGRGEMRQHALLLR